MDEETQKLLVQKFIPVETEKSKEHSKKPAGGNKTTMIALITAILSAGGGGTKAVLDSYGDDDFKRVVAESVALADLRWKRADHDRELIEAQIGQLRESVAALKATADLLARGRRDRLMIEESAMGAEPVPVVIPAQESTQSNDSRGSTEYSHVEKSRSLTVPNEMVKQYQNKLFDR